MQPRESADRRGESRGIRRFLVGGLTLAVVTLTLDGRAQDADPQWQPPATIAAAARAAVAALGGGEIEEVAVDERIKLKLCASALDTDVARGLQRGRATVAVSCRGPVAWRLFVPVRARSAVPVLVIQRSLQPGEVLRAEHLAIERQPASALPFDYVSDVTQAVGLTVRRTQTAGSVLALSALDYPQVVERGALVTLISQSGPVSVKSEGVALEPGRLRQRIRVRSASGRVIQGTAEGPGQVRVGASAEAG